MQKNKDKCVSIAIRGIRVAFEKDRYSDALLSINIPIFCITMSKSLVSIS